MEQQEFAYVRIEEGIRILRCYGKSSRVVIPEYMEGQPVTELAAYAFAQNMEEEPENSSGMPCISGSDLEELCLPKTIVKIGRYAFYNCLHFHKLSFYSNIAFMGAGLFTGCEKLSRLNMQELLEERSCLLEILSELKQTVDVKVYHGKTCQYQLIYPEFYEEAVENTPARIIETHTHGMGIQYRNAFEDTRVIFSEYDKLFEMGKYNIDLHNAVLMAAARLMYPVELEEIPEQGYRKFLREHLKGAATAFLEDEEQQKLQWMAEYFIDTKEEMDILMQTAMERKETEALSMLIDICRRRFPQRRKKFSL